jgi:arylsulfatase A-like enzyme
VPGCRGVSYGPAAEDHQTTWCAEKACDFIRDRAEDSRPWLFSVNMFDPHHSFDAPEAYVRRYLDMLDDIPLPNYSEGELDDKPVWQRIDHRGSYGGGGLDAAVLNEREHRMLRASYWAMCDLIDEQVGRMLTELEATGQRQHTLVIYQSDHGELLGDHGIYCKGPYFYDCAIRVPLLVNWPERIAPGSSAALVELVDLPQTILDAVGLPHHPGMQGQSLWPLLCGEAPRDRHRNDVYCEYYNAMPFHRDPSAHATMVRTTRHKLVCAHSLDTGELYDLEMDPAETHNRWDDPACTETKLRLLQRLCNRMAWTVDPLPVRQGPW